MSNVAREQIKAAAEAVQRGIPIEQAVQVITDSEAAAILYDIVALVASERGIALD